MHHIVIVDLPVGNADPVRKDWNKYFRADVTILHNHNEGGLREMIENAGVALFYVHRSWIRAKPKEIELRKLANTYANANIAACFIFVQQDGCGEQEDGSVRAIVGGIDKAFWHCSRIDFRADGSTFGERHKDCCEEHFLKPLLQLASDGGLTQTTFEALASKFDAHVINPPIASVMETAVERTGGNDRFQSKWESLNPADLAFQCLTLIHLSSLRLDAVLSGISSDLAEARRFIAAECQLWTKLMDLWAGKEPIPMTAQAAGLFVHLKELKRILDEDGAGNTGMERARKLWAEFRDEWEMTEAKLRKEALL
jgi:hypothetical protein